MSENTKRLYMMKAHDAMDLASKAEIAAAYAFRCTSASVVKAAYDLCVDAALALAETNAPTRSETLLGKAKKLQTRLDGMAS